MSVHAKARAAMDAGVFLKHRKNGETDEWTPIFDVVKGVDAKRLDAVREARWMQYKHMGDIQWYAKTADALAAAYDALFPGQGPRYVVEEKRSYTTPDGVLAKCYRCGATPRYMRFKTEGADYVLVCADGCDSEEEK